MKENKKDFCMLVPCVFCGEMHEIWVSADDYWDWEPDMHVQDVFPYLSPEEREMLISGICPDCWEKMFPPEEEDEEDPEDEGWVDDIWDDDDWDDDEEEDEGDDIYTCELESLGENWW